jgi:hypothetical protein
MLRTKRQGSGEPGAAADAQVVALERENQRLRDLVRCCLTGLPVVLVLVVWSTIVGAGSLCRRNPPAHCRSLL